MPPSSSLPCTVHPVLLGIFGVRSRSSSVQSHPVSGGLLANPLAGRSPFAPSFALACRRGMIPTADCLAACDPPRQRSKDEITTAPTGRRRCRFTRQSGLANDLHRSGYQGQRLVRRSFNNLLSWAALGQPIPPDSEARKFTHCYSRGITRLRLGYRRYRASASALRSAYPRALAMSASVSLALIPCQTSRN